LAYVAVSAKEEFVVVDGREEAHFARAFALGAPKTPLSALFKTPTRPTTKEKGIVVAPVFSPDGKRLAYGVAVGPHREFAVLDGKQGKNYKSIADRSLVFSPDSQRLAYWAEAGRHCMVVVDGNEQRGYDGPNTTPPPPAFSPDSKHLAYTAIPKDSLTRIGRRHQRLVVDDREEQTQSDILEGTLAQLGQVVFDSPNRLHLIENRWPEIYLVEYEIP